MDYALEIHHIDVGGGDATAILMKDENENITTKVLIDAGASGGGSGNLTSYIDAYLEPATPFHYVIASHYHDDHIKGFAESKISFSRYVDVGGYSVTGDADVGSANGPGFRTQASYFTAYAAHIDANRKAAQLAIRLPLPFIRRDGAGPKGPVVITLGDGGANGATLTCYCAGGMLADGTNVLAPQRVTKGRAFNPNDLSLAFVVEWGSFRYFTAGDLSGDPALQSYYNMEGSLVTYLTGLNKLPITAMKITHHGSERSSYFNTGTNTGFLDALAAKTLIIPCNVSKQVPHPIFLSRVYNYALPDAGTGRLAATVLFLNEISYQPGDAEYAGTQQIINEPALNCNAIVNNTDQDKINNDARGIVLRRIAAGVAEVLKPGMNETIAYKTDASNNHYAVIIRGPRFARTGGTSRRSTYQIAAPIQSYLMGNIQKGFANQAEAIVNWLNRDQLSDQQIGLEYLREFFPGFLPLIPSPLPANAVLQAALVAKLQALFDHVYTLNNIIRSYTINNLALNPLPLDDRITIYYTLTNNKYQDNLALMWSNKAVSRKRQAAIEYWNSYEEPYQGLAEPEASIEKGLKKSKPETE